MAVIEDLQVVDRHSWLIRPAFNEYEFWNTKVHGLSSEDTEFAPEFDEVWWELGSVISESRLLAHNAGFDMRVLRALAEKYELAPPRYEYACTVTLARKAMHELPRHTLDTVCDECGISLMHHDAASDAEACAQVALACAEKVGATGISEALELLGVRVGRL